MKRYRPVLLTFFVTLMLLSTASLAFATDTFEPNNAMGNATPMSVGTPLSSYLSTPNDIDVYAIHLEPGNYRFVVTPPSNIRLEVRFDSATTYGHSSLAYHDWIYSEAGDAVELTYSASKADTYYLTTYSGGFGDDTPYNASQPYQVKAEKVTDTLEPNNDIDNAVPVVAPGVFTSYLSAANDMDVYRLYLTPGQFQVDVNPPANISPVIWLGPRSMLDDPWSRTAYHGYDSDGHGKLAQLPWSITQSGFYYVAVESGAYGWEDTPYNYSTPYTLTIRATNVAQKLPVVVDAIAPGAVAPGSSSVLWLALRCDGSAIPGRTLSVQRIGAFDADWTTIGSVVSQTSAVPFTVSPALGDYYRVVFSGDQYYAASTKDLALRAVKPKASVGTPSAPKTMKKSKTYAVYGSLKPRHASGTRPVRIYKYKKVSGKWKGYGYTTAKVYNYASYSRYKASIKLKSKGSWRLRAYAPDDSLHSAAWSAKYDYVTVK